MNYKTKLKEVQGKNPDAIWLVLLGVFSILLWKLIIVGVACWAVYWAYKKHHKENKVEVVEPERI